MIQVAICLWTLDMCPRIVSQHSTGVGTHRWGHVYQWNDQQLETKVIRVTKIISAYWSVGHSSRDWGQGMRMWLYWVPRGLSAAARVSRSCHRSHTSGESTWHSPRYSCWRGCHCPGRHRRGYSGGQWHSRTPLHRLVAAGEHASCVRLSTGTNYIIINW